MSLRLLLDADIQDRKLVEVLRSAGHDVQTANDAGLRLAKDEELFAHACRDDRAVLTYNTADFRILHEGMEHHPGLFLVYKYGIDRKNLTFAEIAHAIANIEVSRMTLRGQVFVLNTWNF